MELQIYLFANLAQHFGSSSVKLSIEQKEITAQHLKRLLIERFPQAADVIAISFIAKNHAYAAPEDKLEESDEIALIPPVSGGQDPIDPSTAETLSPTDFYTITKQPISVEDVTQKVIHPLHGAALTFVGTTREFTSGKRTTHLEYEGYEPMALLTMKQIGDEISEKWPGTICAITHRLGKVDIAEISVVIAVSSPHRVECYEASRYAIERLKQIVPIWKKEIWEDGSEWKGHQQGPWNPTV